MVGYRELNCERAGTGLGFGERRVGNCERYGWEKEEVDVECTVVSTETSLCKKEPAGKSIEFQH